MPTTSFNDAVVKKQTKTDTTFISKKYERPGLKQDEIEELKEAFDLFDTDQINCVELSELRPAMTSLGYESKNDTIFTMMNELGDGSTTLAFGSFLDMMAPKDGTDEREGRDEIDKIFSLFDVEGKGVITVRDITKVCRELGERLSNDEVHEIVRRAGSDETSMEITADEFYQIMIKKTFP